MGSLCLSLSSFLLFFFIFPYSRIDTLIWEFFSCQNQDSCKYHLALFHFSPLVFFLFVCVICEQNDVKSMVKRMDLITPQQKVYNSLEENKNGTYIFICYFESLLFIPSFKKNNNFIHLKWQFIDINIYINLLKIINDETPSRLIT